MQSATDFLLSGTKELAVRHEHQIDQLHVCCQHFCDEKNNAMALTESILCMHVLPCVEIVYLNRFIAQSGSMMTNKFYEQHTEHVRAITNIV